MANYDIFRKAKFDPFTYEEMVAPIKLATEAHQALEDKYSALNASAGAWDKILDPEVDAEALLIYDNFRSRVAAARDLLWSKGLTPGARRNVTDLTGLYSTDIAPLTEAYKARNIAITGLVGAKEKDNTIRYEIDADKISLMDYMRNPIPIINSVSGNRVRGNVANMIKSLTQEITEHSKTWSDLFTDKIRTKYGLSSDIVAALLNDPSLLTNEDWLNSKEGGTTIAAIINQAVEQENLDSWLNSDYKELVREFLVDKGIEGLYSGIGAEQISYQNNPWRTKIWEMEQQAARQAMANFRNPIPVSLYSIAQGAGSEDAENLLKGNTYTKNGVGYVTTNLADLLNDVYKKFNDIRRDGYIMPGENYGITSIYYLPKGITFKDFITKPKYLQYWTGLIGDSYIGDEEVELFRNMYKGMDAYQLTTGQELKIPMSTIVGNTLKKNMYTALQYSGAYSPVVGTPTQEAANFNLIMAFPILDDSKKDEVKNRLLALSIPGVGIPEAKLVNDENHNITLLDDTSYVSLEDLLDKNSLVTNLYLSVVKDKVEIIALVTIDGEPKNLRVPTLGLNDWVRNEVTALNDIILSGLAGTGGVTKELAALALLRILQLVAPSLYGVDVEPIKIKAL